MDADDLEPRTTKMATVNIEAMSIAALEDYIGDLEAEIRRARATAEAKKAARASADSVFRI